MDNNLESPNETKASVARAHISGTPTIAELRRRVWVRAHPKEQSSKAGRKPRASK